MNKVETSPRHEEISAMDLPLGGVGRVVYPFSTVQECQVVMRTYTGLVSLIDGMTWTYDTKEGGKANSMKVIPVLSVTIKVNIPWLN